MTKKNLSLLKKKNFGISYQITNFLLLKSFGLPKSRTYQYSRILGKEFFLEDFTSFFEIKTNKSVNITVLSNPSFFGLGLKRYLSKRIKLLKFNRSYRGIRHSQSLPVRGQRSKTNARTQSLSAANHIKN